MTAANTSLPTSCFAQEAQRPPLGDVPDTYLSRLSPFERSLTIIEEGGTQAPCALLVPKGFEFREGAPLWDGVVIGRFLGAGVQARVFELSYEDGSPAGKVVKIAHKDLGHTVLNSIFIGMEREWEVGVQLRAALEEAGGQLPGFMRVCDCVVQAEGASKARFSGMIMEKINGWEVYKRIDTPEFHNIHYIREMLFQVFSALDRAQRRVGFHHADLGLRNVMEHYPQLWEEIEEQQERESMAAVSTGESLPHGVARVSVERHDASRGGAAAAAGGGAGGRAGPEAQPGTPPRQGGLRPGPRSSGEAAKGEAEGDGSVSSEEGPACPECDALASAHQSGVPTAAAFPAAAAAAATAAAAAAAGPAPRLRCVPCEAAAAAEATPATGLGPPAAAAPPLARSSSAAAEARCIPCEAVSHAARRQPSWRRGMGCEGPVCPRVRPRAGYSCSENGARQPLGPQIEFKVIDYGVATFDDTLAQAAGGYEAYETLARIRKLFAERREAGAGMVREELRASAAAGEAASSTKEGSTKSGMEMTTSEDNILPGKRPKRAWKLLPTGVTGRFKVKRSLAARPGSPTPSSSAQTDSGASSAPTPTSAKFIRPPPRDASSMQHKESPPPKLSKTAPRMGPIERMYRQFWQHKGDVFHLLLSLALVLDDRVWPKEDQREVNMFISLVHHVTGVKLRASFAHPDDDVAVSCFGLRELRQRYGRRRELASRFGHWFRRWGIRLGGHLRPYNSGLTAGEALVAPFFGAGRVQHAKLPVCTAMAFPASTRSE